MQNFLTICHRPVAGAYLYPISIEPGRRGRETRVVCARHICSPCPKGLYQGAALVAACCVGKVYTGLIVVVRPVPLSTRTGLVPVGCSANEGVDDGVVWNVIPAAVAEDDCRAVYLVGRAWLAYLPPLTWIIGFVCSVHGQIACVQIIWMSKYCIPFKQSRVILRINDFTTYFPVLEGELNLLSR